MKKEIEINEVIKIFFNKTIYEIKSEIEIPNINFHFNDNNYQLFKENNIKQKDIDFFIKHYNDNCLSIEINNTLSFFQYLTNIINETINLFKEYGNFINPIETVEYLLRRIWLRMGINDLSDINNFLKNQLQFIKNRHLDCYEEKIIKNDDKYKIYMKTKVNDFWDETTRKMVFIIKNNNELYELPHILYDIDDNNTCYIYGVQSSQNEKNKHIERKLYKLNKGIDNPNVHPSKVCSLLLFINELRKNNIYNIIVPSLQVLSYHYHELLSIESKKYYEEIIKEYNDNPNDIYLKNRLEYLKKWYLHVYQKEDKISYLKTEELIYLMYRLLEHDSDIEIVNEVNLQGDYLNVKIKK